jgi:hypothetical protein
LYQGSHSWSRTGPSPMGSRFDFQCQRLTLFQNLDRLCNIEAMEQNR